MRRILLLALIGYGLWNYYGKAKYESYEAAQEPIFDRQAIEKAEEAAAIISNNFRCDGRQYCSQMTSREEAVFFAKYCPNTQLDGDSDGEPCENDSRW
ncbi:MAG TPA: excalibur calcium-binding domain-containing protein [Pseudomonadales bacterium]|nr:excalibur calcium-binding domain-containing protein [Pseudomonadales bacterium]